MILCFWILFLFLPVDIKLNHFGSPHAAPWELGHLPCYLLCNLIKCTQTLLLLLFLIILVPEYSSFCILFMFAYFCPLQIIPKLFLPDYRQCCYLYIVDLFFHCCLALHWISENLIYGFAKFLFNVQWCTWQVRQPCHDWECLEHSYLICWKCGSVC